MSILATAKKARTSSSRSSALVCAADPSLCLLANTSRVDFTLIRDHLELSDSDLSKQMAALSGANYVTVKQTGKGADREPGTPSQRRAIQR